VEGDACGLNEVTLDGLTVTNGDTVTDIVTEIDDVCESDCVVDELTELDGLMVVVRDCVDVDRLEGAWVTEAQNVDDGVVDSDCVNVD